MNQAGFIDATNLRPNFIVTPVVCMGEFIIKVYHYKQMLIVVEYYIMHLVWLHLTLMLELKQISFVD